MAQQILSLYEQNLRWEEHKILKSFFCWRPYQKWSDSSKKWDHPLIKAIKAKSHFMYQMNLGRTKNHPVLTLKISLPPLISYPRNIAHTQHCHRINTF